MRNSGGDRGHALSTPFGALKPFPPSGNACTYLGACPLNALRGTETSGRSPPRWRRSRGACPLNALRGTETRVLLAGAHPGQRRGHALSTPFGALKRPLGLLALEILQAGHALSTPFGALKHASADAERRPLGGACPLNALRGTETPARRGRIPPQPGGMPSQRPSGH